ncbi:MAG: outer membrane protein [Phycisphaerae bacterium]
MRLLTAAIASAALFVSAHTVSAADLPPQPAYKAPPPIALYNWTGFYIGAHAGYGWGDGNVLGGSNDLDGWFIGGQLGYNWHFAGTPWVLGFEVDSAWADFGDSTTFLVPGGLVGASTEFNYFGTARVRVGYAIDRVLLYLTGGLAWGHNEIAVVAPVGPFLVGATSDNTHFGWTFGGGLEWALWDNWSAKVEYLYADLGSETYFGGILGGVPADAQLHTLKIGLNYRFGGGGYYR